MKITSVKAFPLTAPVSPFAASSNVMTFRARTNVLVKVSTDEGITGWGETGFIPPDTFATGIREELTPILVGKDPCAPLIRRRELRRALRGWRAGLVSGIGALEMALWDIKGKAEGQSVCRLFGGDTSARFPASAEAIFYDADDPRQIRRRIEQAEEWVQRGLRGLKVKIGGISPTDDTAHVKAIMRAVGPDVMISVDANCAYSMPTARHIAEEMADLGVYWFEEPMLLDDVAGYSEIARSSRGMLVAGGQSLPWPEAFLPLLEARGLHLVQPTVSAVGGIAEAVRLAGISEAFGIRYSPHHWGIGVLMAASVHLRAIADAGRPASPFPDWQWVGFDATANPLASIVTDAPTPANDGFVAVPQGPGLGVEVDEALLQRFVTGSTD